MSGLLEFLRRAAPGEAPVDPMAGSVMDPRYIPETSGKQLALGGMRGLLDFSPVGLMDIATTAINQANVPSLVALRAVTGRQAPPGDALVGLLGHGQGAGYEAGRAATHAALPMMGLLANQSTAQIPKAKLREAGILGGTAPKGAASAEKTLALESVPRSVPKELAREIAQWDEIHKSPYSYSFYNAPGKTWDNTPEGVLRLADHWNFPTSFDSKIHARTRIDVPDGTWAIGQYRDGAYDILKQFKKVKPDGADDVFNRWKNVNQRIIAQLDLPSDARLFVDPKNAKKAGPALFKEYQDARKALHALPNWDVPKSRADRYTLQELLSAAE